MKITNLKELKEASKLVDGAQLERRFKALTLMNKTRQYIPNYDALYQCSYCPEMSSFWGICPACGEEMHELEELNLEDLEEM